MTKEQIATLLFRMKKMHQSIVTIQDELFSVDELLTMYFGAEITEDVAQEFLA